MTTFLIPADVSDLIVETRNSFHEAIDLFSVTLKIDTVQE